MTFPAQKDRRPAQPAEDERQARLEKTARLKQLRSYASWLSSDPNAQLHDEIDCSVLIDEGVERRGMEPWLIGR
ncbi:hypothetical protein [Mesorhizobium sp. L2C084A000]|uniref:hypothetical protein n=1 Tax=unclassified Mesorhizobium TaxID=325217 RepID=UPI0003D041FC|nr:hypothetical protein [Mesorhizobium sp. L2C084A000]ESZ28005.1 hypothetical protein X734_09250 [Mesorhizobium sp. L2C084A000]